MPARDAATNAAPLPSELPPIYPSRKWPPAHKVRPANAVSAAKPVAPVAPASAAPAAPVAAAPAAPVATAGKPEPVTAPTPIPEVPTITVGHILIEDLPAASSPPKALAKPAPASPLSGPTGGPAILPADLKHRVQRACGSLARNVQVVPQGNRDLLVKIRVDDAAQQEKVLKRVLALPDMASPQVRIEVEVGK
jgi:hypothetical protein